MKLMTRQIRTSLKNCHSDMQLTLEDDINVPDSKPDIEHIIKIQGEIHVQETSAETDRCHHSWSIKLLPPLFKRRGFSPNTYYAGTDSF